MRKPLNQYYGSGGFSSLSCRETYEVVNDAIEDFLLWLESFPPAWATTPGRVIEGEPPRPWTATIYQEEGTHG